MTWNQKHSYFAWIKNNRYSYIYSAICHHNKMAIKYIVSAVLALLLLISGTSYAVLGGGVSTIGIPEMEAALFEADCGTHRWDGIAFFQHFAGSPVLKFGGAAYLDHLWVSQSTNPVHTNNFAAAYSDDTGVFWDFAEYNAAYIPGSNICGVSAQSKFQQSFTKDVDTAWVKFTVSHAYLFADRGVAWQNNFGSGGSSRILMEAYLQKEADGWSEHEQFFTEAILRTKENGPWATPYFLFDTPMNYTMTRDETDVKEVSFDKYTGSINISSVPVGGVFTVSFRSFALAEGGGVAESPMRMQAYIRDPLTTGGGISFSVEGVTPLNKILSTPMPRDRAQAQVIQVDGKIVAAGQAYVNGNDDFALARYNADGTLDTSFGSTGKITTDFAGSSDVVYALALQADGKIVAAGKAGITVPTRLTGNSVTSSDFAIARYNTDGTLDTSFGTGGKVTLDFSGKTDVARAVAIQGDGKIVVAGSAQVGGNQDFAITRLNSDGSLDTSFNATGKVTTDFVAAADYAYAMAVQSDGKIVVAGQSDSGSGTQSDFALARYNSDGTLDAGFGIGGKVTTDFLAGSEVAQALAIQNDGKIIAVGWAFNGANNDFAMTRYNTDGSLDTACGGSGKVLRDFAGTHDEASAVAIQSDGKIVVGGNTQVGTQRDFAMARFTSFCSVDTNYGTTQVVTADFAGKDDRIAALTIQTDGKIVATGYAVTTTGDDFAMLRANP